MKPDSLTDRIIRWGSRRVVYGWLLFFLTFVFSITFTIPSPLYTLKIDLVMSFWLVYIIAGLYFKKSMVWAWRLGLILDATAMVVILIFASYQNRIFPIPLALLFILFHIYSIYRSQ